MGFGEPQHPGWTRSLEWNYGRFAFQGDRQFYADVTSIMEFPSATDIPSYCFRLGCDGGECWFTTFIQDRKKHAGGFLPVRGNARAEHHPLRSVRVENNFPPRRRASRN